MEVEKLIESFKSANQSLRKRAIAIGILMLIAIALKYSEEVRLERVSGLIDYEYSLEMIYKLSDSNFQEVINNGGFEYFTDFSDENLDRFRLFEKVKEDDFQRTLISNTIDNIDLQIDELNKAQSISLMGFTIPLEPIIYLSLIFVLILFHDFTQIVVFRNQVYRRIRNGSAHSLELGFEFFGFYNRANNSGTSFLKVVSTIITSILILCPIATSLLMLGLNRSNSITLGIVNAFCFFIIAIDTIIILQTENRLNFRYLSNRFLGKHNLSITKMRLIWSLPIIVILTIELVAGIIMFVSLGEVGVFFFIFCLLPIAPLYFSLEHTYQKPTRINRSIRAGLLLLNIFWVISVFYELIFRKEWLMKDVLMMGSALLVATLFSSVFGLIYGLFFIRMTQKKPKKF